jgi:predicted nuclease with TOPRIM domain
MNDIHSCSYYCHRPACIKAQRDELRDKLTEAVAERDALLEALKERRAV